MKICVATMGPLGLADTAQACVRDYVDGAVAINPGEISDFSRARNLLLREAHLAGYDWAIMLDTDEQLQFGTLLRIPGEVLVDNDSARFALQDTLRHTKSDVLMVAQADGTYAKERIFRLPVRGRYVGPTHEAFILDPGVSRNILEGVTFTEEPKTPEQYRAKAERDLRILERMTEDDPEDARWWYYLGDTRAGLGDWKGAVYAFTRCFYCKGWDEEGAWAAFRTAQLYAEQKEWGNALLWCSGGMTLRADFPELPWLAGWCCYQQGNYQQAIAWSRLALAHSADPHALAYPDTPRIIFRHPPAHYEAPYDVLRWSLRQLGEDTDQAEGFFKTSLAKRQKSERRTTRS
jgi:hypothetical protein